VSASRRIAPGSMFDPTRDGPTPELLSADPQRVADFTWSAFITYSLADFRPARLQAQLPGLRIADGARSRELPPLVLDASAVQLLRAGGSGPTAYRTGEASAAVMLRYEQCLRNAQREPAQCRQILDFDDRGFDIDRGGVRYAGRWYVFDANAPFRGELTIEHKTPAAWQLAPGEIRLRDAAGAATSPARIDGMTVHLRYAAPFASAFTGANNDSALPFTKVSLVMRLPPAAGGAAAQRYVLRLPDISIDGTLMPLRPVEFERRRFDVGVLPFNC